MIEKAVADLKDAHKLQDMDKIESASKELNDAWQAASQDIYKATEGDQASPEGAPNDNSEGGEEEVTDVEFEEVEDK